MLGKNRAHKPINDSHGEVTLVTAAQKKRVIGKGKATRLGAGLLNHYPHRKGRGWNEGVAESKKIGKT